MRGKADEIAPSAGVAGYVTGTTALNIDTADRLAEALPMYVAVVVGLALILLTSCSARSWCRSRRPSASCSRSPPHGPHVWIFQDGNLADLLGVSQAGPIVSFLPILMIGILFGLPWTTRSSWSPGCARRTCTRRREAGHRHRLRPQRPGGDGGGGDHDLGLRRLHPRPERDREVHRRGPRVRRPVDAFVVRMTLVPAVMALMGKAAWWLPKGVDKRLPDIDIEGNKLLDGLRDAPTPA
jgi:RND superfamily putative drug exporter